jgi:hypothetical protein
MRDEEVYVMGDVIQMFSRPPDPGEEGGEFEVRTVLTDELEQSVLDVQAELETLWLAQSRDEFKEMIRRIKWHVREWPDE